MSEESHVSSTPKNGAKRKVSHQKKKHNKRRKVSARGIIKKSLEESDTEDEINWKQLEEELERNASKANLTATNVKSILHHILSDKRVIDYAQHAAQEDSAPENILQGAKITRSKARMMGQESVLPIPIKSKPKQSILDVEFSESSDEDYQPQEEDEDDDADLSQASDDNASVLSDITDLPTKVNNLVTGMSSPELFQVNSTVDHQSINTRNILGSQENTDSLGSVAANSKEHAKNLFKIPDLPEVVDEPPLIAMRTRSRFPMPDIEVEEIEAMFKPPDAEHLKFPIDFTDDPDELIWKSWLADLTKPMKALNDTNDDPNDEDFNYMEAIEEDTEAEIEELRDDKATRVTQKELQEMFNELLLGYDNPATFQQEQEVLFSEFIDSQEANAEEEYTTVLNAAKDLQVTVAQRQQISAQIQQHVQLLTQVYLLTSANKMYKNESTTCKQYIEELARFHDKVIENTNQQQNTQVNVDCSMFCTPGILQAAEIVKSLSGKRIVTKCPKNSMKNEFPICETITSILAGNPYFATFIELLPHRGLYIPTNSSKHQNTVQRMKFTDAEDNLLALGLQQFTGKDKYHLIAEHMLPTKTPKQLEVRKKNLCSQNSQYNPVYLLIKEGAEVLDLPVETKITIPRAIATIPLCELPRKVWKGQSMPLWYRNIRKKLHLDMMCNEIIKSNNNKEEVQLTPTLQNNHPSQELSNLLTPTSNQPIIFQQYPVAMVTPTIPVIYPQPFYSQPSLLLKTNQQIPFISMMPKSTSKRQYKRRNSSKKTKRSLEYIDNTPKLGETVIFSHTECVASSDQNAISTKSSNEPVHILTNDLNIRNTTVPVVGKFENSSYPEQSNPSPFPVTTLAANISFNAPVFTNSFKLQQPSNPLQPANILPTISASETMQLHQTVKDSRQTQPRDVFNMPVNDLLSALPSVHPSVSVPFSQSKHLPETSFTEVKNVLMTPRRFDPVEKEVCGGNPNENPSLPIEHPSVVAFSQSNPLPESSLTEYKNIFVTPRKFDSTENEISEPSANETVREIRHSIVRNNENLPEDSFRTPKKSNEPVGSQNSFPTDVLTTPTTSLSCSKGYQHSISQDIDIVDGITAKDTEEVDIVSFTKVSEKQGNVSTTLVTPSLEAVSLPHQVIPTHHQNAVVENSSSTSSSMVNGSISSSQVVTNTTTFSQVCSSLVTTEKYGNLGTGSPVNNDGTANIDLLKEAVAICSQEKVSCTSSSSKMQVVLSGSGSLSYKKLELAQNNIQRDSCSSSPARSPGFSNVLTPSSQLNQSVASSSGCNTPVDHSPVTSPKLKEKNTEVTKSNSSKVPFAEQLLPDAEKKKIRRRKKTSKASRQFNFDEKLRQKAKQFAEIYFNRVNEVLSSKEELYTNFLSVMESSIPRIDKFYKVQELLCDYPELVDNFAGFLEQHEARHVGKYMQWLMYDSVIHFHLTCEEYFYEKPGHYEKIIEKIIEVTDRTRDSQKIVDGVKPLFRGNQDLLHQFIRLFPDLPPPEIYDEDFDEFDFADFEEINFAAVKSGVKIIDDFEEIPYQQPAIESDTVTQSDDGKHRNKRNNKKNRFFSKKKSNRDIAANKLKRLANRRKKVKKKTNDCESESCSCIDSAHDQGTHCSGGKDVRGHDELDGDTCLSDMRDQSFNLNDSETVEIHSELNSFRDLSHSDNSCKKTNPEIISSPAVVLYDILQEIEINECKVSGATVSNLSEIVNTNSQLNKDKDEGSNPSEIDEPAKVIVNNDSVIRAPEEDTNILLMSPDTRSLKIKESSPTLDSPSTNKSGGIDNLLKSPRVSKVADEDAPDNKIEGFNQQQDSSSSIGNVFENLNKKEIASSNRNANKESPFSFDAVSEEKEERAVDVTQESDQDAIKIDERQPKVSRSLDSKIFPAQNADDTPNKQESNNIVHGSVLLESSFSSEKYIDSPSESPVFEYKPSKKHSEEETSDEESEDSEENSEDSESEDEESMDVDNSPEITSEVNIKREDLVSSFKSSSPKPNSASQLKSLERTLSDSRDIHFNIGSPNAEFVMEISSEVSIDNHQSNNGTGDVSTYKYISAPLHPATEGVIDKSLNHANVNLKENNSDKSVSTSVSTPKMLQSLDNSHLGDENAQFNQSLSKPEASPIKSMPKELSLQSLTFASNTLQENAKEANFSQVTSHTLLHSNLTFPDGNKESLTASKETFEQPVRCSDPTNISHQEKPTKRLTGKDLVTLASSDQKELCNLESKGNLPHDQVNNGTLQDLSQTSELTFPSQVNSTDSMTSVGVKKSISNESSQFSSSLPKEAKFRRLTSEDIVTISSISAEEFANSDVDVPFTQELFDRCSKQDYETDSKPLSTHKEFEIFGKEKITRETKVEEVGNVQEATSKSSSSWKIEEDKIILTAVKEYEDEKDACDFIMKEGKLEGRSADEIRERIDYFLEHFFTSESESENENETNN